MAEGIGSKTVKYKAPGKFETFDTLWKEENPGNQIGLKSNPRILWKLLCTPIIEVFVGPEKHCFRLHQGLLMRHSLFFRTMLRCDEFKEGKERIVTLPDDEVLVFAVFAEWLYAGSEADSGDIFVQMHGKDINEEIDDNYPNGNDEVSAPEAEYESASEVETVMDEELESDDEEDEEDRQRKIRRRARRQFIPRTMYDSDAIAASEEIIEEEEEPPANDPDLEGMPELITEEAAAAMASLSASRASYSASVAEIEEVEEEEVWETGSTLPPAARHDHYDFSLQFQSYVLADKLIAPEFKAHMLDEIRFHGEFAGRAHVTVDHVRYVYQNTPTGDPLRKFCLSIKCVGVPIHITLGDPDFQNLMEEGGPLVRDIMEICRKFATEERWHMRAIILDDGY